jgi:hypothetical protein
MLSVAGALAAGAVVVLAEADAAGMLVWSAGATAGAMV